MLVAVDAQGREWRSGPLLIHMTHPAELFNQYVSRKLDSIMFTRRWPLGNEHHVRLYIPKQSRFPFDQRTKYERTAGETLVEGGWSVDHHVRAIGEAAVTFRREDDGWLSITATQSTPFMPDWHGTMCHALSFAASRIVRPAAVARTFDGDEVIGLFSGPFHRFRSLMPRPIVGLSPEDTNAFWSLVEQLFHFAWASRGSQSRLLDELNAIHAGAVMSIETACLTLAIGIEALAKELLPSAPSPGWNIAAKQSIESHIAAWPGDSATKDRVLGWLQSKGEPRAVDRLYAWATQHEVKHGLVDAWSALRNRRAHGTAVDDSQPSYDLYYAVVELLYRLVASLIGYDGRILETSVRGWGRDGEGVRDGSARRPI